MVTYHSLPVCRTHKEGTLRVRTEGEEDSVATGSSEGTFSVLDLDQLYTRFYVGGVPTRAGVRHIM